MKKYVATLVLGAVVVCGLMPFVHTARAADDEKTADIRKLLELTGAGNLGANAAQQMIAQFRTSMPDVPAKFWDDFAKEIKADELTELMIPVYANHLDAADIKELIKFYESPVGKKLSAALPQITQESMQVGQQWGQQMAQKVMAKMKEQGITPGAGK